MASTLLRTLRLSRKSSVKSGSQMLWYALDPFPPWSSAKKPLLISIGHEWLVNIFVPPPGSWPITSTRFGTYSVDVGLNAGVDLEMPGLNKWRTLELVNRSIQARKVTTKTIKLRARKVLEFVQKCAKGAPEVGWLGSIIDTNQDLWFPC